EPARGRKPVLRDELAAVVVKQQYPPERLCKICRRPVEYQIDISASIGGLLLEFGRVNSAKIAYIPPCIDILVATPFRCLSL
ncbi:MAG: hypothetical protein JXA30_16840, partial [Deltaproteobacteria bacterium]|nr:hypothetical protein [Deltaproteobacteria bacterium]